MKGHIKLHIVCDCGETFEQRLDNDNKSDNIFFVCPACAKVGHFIFWWAATTTGKKEDYNDKVVINKQEYEQLKNLKTLNKIQSGGSLIGP